MTALVVLDDHMVPAGQSGPTIPVSAADVAAYQADAASQQSVVPVDVGETLTEEQALEALLVASGNNIATLLATWDAGSLTAFVAKMNATAHRLGLFSTTFDDPTGVSSANKSTTSDLIRLGHAAMSIPLFAQTVGMTQVTLPVGGTFYNLDTDIGHNGFVGIKTGSDAAAGGCFLFEAITSFFGKTLTLEGVVLGQRAAPQTATAVREANALVGTAWAALTTVHPVSLGLAVGHIVAAWGPVTPVNSSSAPPVIGWPGLAVPVKVLVPTPASDLRKGTQVGVVRVSVGTELVDVPLRTKTSLGGPSVVWRLTRL